MNMPQIPIELLTASGVLILYFSMGQIYFWFVTEKEKSFFRFNLLSSGWLNRFLKKPYIQFCFQLPVFLIFAFIIYAGLVGHYIINIAPILTWTIWWAGLIFLVAIGGKAWCYVCPWDFIAGLFVRLKPYGVSRNPLTLGWKWPVKLKNIYPAILLFLALTWFELGFNVTSSPRATAYIAIAMIFLSAVPAIIFEKKPYCRHACLVGRISGLYALFSPVEVRSKDRNVCLGCRTKDCYNGNENGMPCPTSLNLTTLEDNTYCIMCTECIKSCPHDNVAVNIRPFGADIEKTITGKPDEAYLAIVMLAMTIFHGLTMTTLWERSDSKNTVLGFIESLLNNNRVLSFTVGMIFILLIPFLVQAGGAFASKFFLRNKDRAFSDIFIKFSYSLLPVALFYHLAHNISHLLTEGQNVLTLVSDPLGRGADIFGTAAVTFKPFVSQPLIWFLQITLIAIGQYWGLRLALFTAAGFEKEKRRRFLIALPFLIIITLFTVISLGLLGVSMTMRTRM
ncbi:MAG: hypothetical protein HZA77_09840 [Candidatus Schekmanbacteria bacterium]|nr:hypothetical protein [Candidatus Schekmanbacteria bacterium]